MREIQISMQEIRNGDNSAEALLLEFNLESICTSEFFKKLKLHEPLRRVQFHLFEKPTSTTFNFKLNEKNRRLLINNTNMKKFAQEKCRNMFVKAIFFAYEKTFFRGFVIALDEIIGLQNFLLSFCKSQSRFMMCNLHWCYTFCTGSVLHLYIIFVLLL